MKKIQIGNDFTVSWLLTHLGKAFSLVNKTFEIEVSSAYGAILVSDVFAEGNILTFLVPSSQQVYLGSYDVSLSIIDNTTNQRWSLKQCNAFALVPCNSEFVNDEIVQLESGIVFPSHGLSAYELAVLNGYTGTHEEWAEQLIAKPFFNLTLRTVYIDDVTGLLCAEVAGGDVKNGNDYRLRLMRRRKRGRDGRAGWGAVDPNCRRVVNDSSPDWVNELNKVYTEFYLYDYTYEDDDGNSVTIENVVNQNPPYDGESVILPEDIAMCFMAYKNETVEVYSGYKNKRVIGAGPTRVDMQNLGLAIYRYEGDKAVERVSNIAPFGITIIGSYDPNNSIYDKIKFYWNVSENGSRVNPRKLLAFPKPETE